MISTVEDIVDLYKPRIKIFNETDVTVLAFVVDLHGYFRCDVVPEMQVLA